MKKNHTNPWAAIDAIVKANPEPMGPEWFTVNDYTARYGGSNAQNHVKLSADTRFKKWTGVGGPNRRTISKFSLNDAASKLSRVRSIKNSLPQ